MNAHHFLAPRSKSSFSFMTMIIFALIVAAFIWFITFWQKTLVSATQNPASGEHTDLTLQQKMDVLRQLAVLREETYQAAWADTTHVASTHGNVSENQADSSDPDAAHKLEVLKELDESSKNSQ